MDDTGVTTGWIDAHHHVWDLAARDQPWMTGDGMDPLRRTFGVEEFVTQAETNGIAASVVVQTVTDVSETEELLDLAATAPRVAGVVGWVDLAAADVGERLDQLLSLSSGRWLVGIRSLVQYEPDPAWLARPAVLRGLREVARRGLINELLVLPHQLPAVAAAAVEVADGRFVLDHLGKPAIATREVGAVGVRLGGRGAVRQRVGKDLRSGHRSRLVGVDCRWNPPVLRPFAVGVRP